jgi:mRNA interferase HigB
LRESSRNERIHLRVISRRTLREYWEAHADVEDPLKTWFSIAKNARWRNLLEVQLTYSTAEAVGDFTVFNIKGNEYRLVVRIEYRLQIVFIREMLTHAEYDKDRWK